MIISLGFRVCFASESSNPTIDLASFRVVITTEKLIESDALIIIQENDPDSPPYELTYIIGFITATSHAFDLRTLSRR